MKKLALFVATIVAVAFAACCNNAESTEATEEVVEEQITVVEEVAEEAPEAVEEAPVVIEEVVEEATAE